MIYVNQKRISEHDVSQEMQYHPAASQREAMIKAAESLIISELLKQRALELGLAEQVVNLGDEEVLIQKLLEIDVTTPQATSAECLHYFEANKNRFTSSPLVEAKHILLAAEPNDEVARLNAKLEAERLIIALHQGADFEELALAYSDCPSKNTKGHLGQLTRGQTVPEFERAIFHGSAGLQLAPVESRFGFHIVHIERITPGHQLTFEDVEQTIASYLEERVKRKAIAQYIQTLISAAEIAGFDFSVPATPLLQ